MDHNLVQPILHEGRLTCPSCGQSGMPLGRKCCWQCGVSFTEQAATGKDTSNHIESNQAEQRMTHVTTTNQTSASPNWHDLKPQYNKDRVRWLLILNFILALTSCVLAFFPMSNGFNYFVDGKAKIIILILLVSTCMIVAGMTLGNINDLQLYRRMFISCITQLLVLASAILSCIYIESEYSKYSKAWIIMDIPRSSWPRAEQSSHFWCCFLSSIAGIIVTSVIIRTISKSAKYIKSHTS